MREFDLILANCKQCGKKAEFVSRGLAIEGRDYELDAEDIPYDVLEGAAGAAGICPHCMADLVLKTSASAWVEIAR